MEMIEIAAQKVFCENRKEKHSQDAQKGWYYYHTRFALPLYKQIKIKRKNITFIQHVW